MIEHRKETIHSDFHKDLEKTKISIIRQDKEFSLCLSLEIYSELALEKELIEMKENQKRYS